MIDKLVNFAKDFRVIYVVILGAIPIGIWAADTVFQTDKEATIKQVQMIEYDIQDLQVDYGFAETDRERQKIDAKIKLKESHIRQLKEEQ